MKIKVLGSSSSGNCYVLEEARLSNTDYERLILDAGISFTQVMRSINWDYASVRGCLVTHEHRDHCASSYDLARHGIDVYSCPEVAQSVPLVRRMAECKAYRIGFYKAAPFRVPHGDVGCYGYFVWTPQGERVLYATDFQYIPYHFRELKPTHLLIECNYSDSQNLIHEEKFEHVLRGHASLATALGVVEANLTDELRCVVLCHISRSEDAEAMRAFVQEYVGESVSVYVADKGVEIEI